MTTAVIAWCTATVTPALMKITLLRIRVRGAITRTLLAIEDVTALESFKKNFADEVAKVRDSVGTTTSIEVWFQDEMRGGQKNKLTYTWATRGTKPPLIHDQRTQSIYPFGLIHPLICGVLGQVKNREDGGILRKESERAGFDCDWNWRS